ncbi:MAG: XrtA/PEP-CTERM system histidine kinase PrsK [Parasphingopyxis sp.]
MIGAIGQYSHAAAAAVFGLLALWQFSRTERRKAMVVLGVAFGLTAIWAAAAALLGPGAAFARAAETARNLGYLGYLLALIGHGVGDDRRRFVHLVFASLFFVGLLQGAMDIAAGLVFPGYAAEIAIQGSVAALHLTLIIGALLMVNLLYGSAAPEARWGIRQTMIALAAMWGYDLNLYTFAWLGSAAQDELLSLRGLLMVAMVPSFIVATRRSAGLKMKISRQVTFRSLSLVAIFGYFGAMYLAFGAIDAVAGRRADLVQIVLVFLMSAGAILLLPSSRVRAWIKVKFAKHLFEHRYDYRAEWIRFNDTLARPGDQADPLDARVVRAIAEIAGAEGGILLVPREGGGLAPSARWKWTGLEVPPKAGGEGFARWLEASGHIVEIDPLRNQPAEPRPVASLVPDWMLASAGAWAVAPLIHRDRLAGAVLLEQPRIARTLDWEDFDLLKIAGRQAASYLAEAQSHEKLAESRRFDEFNRRFAFILHDIKNIVSQLSLVARNAERHADNPEFRADMVATLRGSVDKMNALLARLAPNERGPTEEPRPIGLRHVAQSVAAQKSPSHPVLLAPGEEALALADPHRIETALAHIVQNAIDASPEATPVRIEVREAQGEARIAVRDRGAGMSGDFVRNDLFRPFSSSKETGFGVGAFEARALVGEMGGRLEVESREGEGSCFTIILPLASQDARDSDERMSA